jgi:hypothetical protein
MKGHAHGLANSPVFEREGGAIERKGQ